MVDPSLRVYGTSNVRLCDASVFPDAVSGHPVRCSANHLLLPVRRPRDKRELTLEKPNRSKRPSLPSPRSSPTCSGPSAWRASLRRSTSRGETFCGLLGGGKEELEEGRRRGRVVGGAASRVWSCNFSHYSWPVPRQSPSRACQTACLAHLSTRVGSTATRAGTRPRPRGPTCRARAPPSLASVLASRHCARGTRPSSSPCVAAWPDPPACWPLGRALCASCAAPGGRELPCAAGRAARVAAQVGDGRQIRRPRRPRGPWPARESLGQPRLGHPLEGNR